MVGRVWSIVIRDSISRVKS